MKKLLNIIKFLFLVIIVIFSMFTRDILIKKHEIKPKKVIIERGLSPKNIYQKLGLEYNIFDRVYFKITANDKKIKNGYYEFNKKLTKYELIEKLMNSNGIEVVLTIPEGFTTDQILNRIESLGLAKKENMLKEMKNYEFYYNHSDNFEGYLFPETYFISKGASEKEILDKILGLFLEKYPPLEFSKDEMYNYLKMASIVEKEANKEEDRKKVAAVFYNRLDKGMLLQSDATLKYELNKNVSKKDLMENDSKYNTYKHKGLVPTPICNPGESSIMAAINPEKDFDMLYFFMYNGKTYYSHTHKEHLMKRKESGHLK